MKKIAVVILNWNGEALLREFLPSVIKFSAEATIYVIDNASTDNAIEVLKNEFPSVTVITNSSNFGFAKGYNEGLKSVNEDYLALLNSDIEVTENWLQPIIELFDNESETAIIQPKILDYKSKSHFEYAGAAGGFIDKYGYPFCRGRIFDTLEEDKGQYDEETAIFWASGACFFIRNEVFQKVNGFDEDFFAHQEEIDLCWRAFNLNYISKYCSKTIVYHLGGATLKTSNPKKTFLNFRNSLCMLTKNLPSKNLVPILISRMLLDGIAGFQMISKGNFYHFVAILKAHFYFYWFFLKFYKKRASFQNKKYYIVKSIVYSYFVEKKRNYNDVI